MAPRPAQRLNSGFNDYWIAIFLSDGWRHHYRASVLSARVGPFGVSGDHPARSDRGRKRGYAAGLCRDHGKLSGRSGLCGG